MNEGEEGHVYVIGGKARGKETIRILERWDVDWIGLVHDRDKWRALVNAVMNIRIEYKASNFSGGRTTGDLSSSASSIKLVTFHCSEIWHPTF
jgi:hypothetical protein